MYDHANRLASVVQGGSTYGFTYNGLNDRVRQTVNATPTTYALDLEGGLTQVLANGSSFYLYGAGRIGEKQAGGWRYHAADALGSVRQLVEAAGTVALARGYAPFGNTLYTDGTGVSAYAFAGETRDATGLTYLRARYYASTVGRFTSRDLWGGLTANPASFNSWLYASANPVNLTDPTGLIPLLTPTGYAEGRALTLEAGAGFAVVEGWEIVYDFVTMERAYFSYREVEPDLDVCTSALGVSASPYFSVIYGFDPPPGGSLTEDWEGHVISGQLGVDIPIGCLPPFCASAGGGLAGFVSADSPYSPNSDVWGYEFYMSLGGGVSLPGFWASKFAVYTTMNVASLLPYNEDIDRLKYDIRSGGVFGGNASPISIVTARRSAAEWAQAWYDERFK